MKKILSGFLGLFAVIGLVAGAGYALFTTSANLNGMVLGTATPGLEVSLDPSADAYAASKDLSNISFAPLLPGQEDWGEFWLRNSSNGTSDPLSLNLQAKIKAADGDWGVLSNAIQARICLYDGSITHCDETNNTGWMTLATWNAAPRNLPGNPLEQNIVGTHYVIVFRIPSSYDNAIAHKTITGMNIEITGTQVL